MKYLKLYEFYKLNHVSENIDSFCKSYIFDINMNKGNSNYQINKDGIYVDGTVCFSNVVINNKNISDYPYNIVLKPTKIPFKFNRVTRHFICSENYLETLENSPEYVGANFDCEKNRLTTLVGGPNTVLGGYLCNNNNLKDVYGFPEFFKNMLKINENPVCEVLFCYNFSLSERIRFIKILNEYTVIRNQDTVIESRLMDTLSELGVKEFPEFNFKNYKLI